MKKLPAALVSALQEFLRTFVFAFLPPVITSLGVIISGIDIVVGGFSIRWILIASILVSGVVSAFQTALISAGDKWLFKKGIETPMDFKSFDSLKK